MTYTVYAEGLCKTFADHPVLDHVDLAVGEGTVFALLGPNGAGKTTLVRILGTLVRPDSGTASVAGCDLLSDPAGVRRSVSLTGQFAAVDDLLTGRENLELMARLRRMPRRTAVSRAKELLAKFDLTDAAERRVSTYSGGMVRRLDLAISMIVRPKLLVLDEPTTGLDPRSRERLWDAVRYLVRDGVTVLLTTQYLEEADQLAGTVALLDHGRIIAEGTPGELKAGLATAVLRLEFPDQCSAARATEMFKLRPGDGNPCVLEVPSAADVVEVHDVLSQLASAGLTATVSINRPSLDDVFFNLTNPGGITPDVNAARHFSAVGVL